MEQNIIQIGNSSGIILPKQLLEKLDLKSGDIVSIEESAIEEIITIRKKGVKSKYPAVRPGFLKLLEKVNKKYGGAFKELAEK